MRITAAMLAAGLALATGACAPRAGPFEALTIDGRGLARPATEPARREKLETELAAARATHVAHPRSEEAAIWHGRRLAYLGRYRDAIAVFSDGLAANPESFKLRRHRGHRYISTRQLNAAITDLSRAAELAHGVPDAPEPDGQPNARNLPRSTDQSNIWYHLALAWYLRGDFERAAEAWRSCLEYSRVNDDMLAATSYWLYLALRRAGRDAEAGEVLRPIHEEMEVIENHAYHRLLLLFRGEMTEAQVAGSSASDLDDASLGYGLGAWRWLQGDRQGALERWSRVVAGPNWAAFGYIAAEAELAREGR